MTEEKTYPVTCISDVEAKEVKWLWQPYVPCGMVTLLEGDPGLGKSWITLAIAKELSVGGRLPGSGVLPPQNTLFFNAEDSLEYTIAPRLKSLGADTDKVFFWNKVAPITPKGLEDMKGFMATCAVGMVFIDPIVAYLGAKMDMNKANEVREIMAGLAGVARDTGAAIIVVRHLKKSHAEGKSIYAGLGSIDFAAAVRSILQVTQTKAGDTVIQHVKSNVAPKGPALSYQLDPVAGTFSWGDFYNGPVEPAKVSNTPKALNKAVEFLKEVLADNPRIPATDIFMMADGLGISEKTIRRAKAELKVGSVQEEGAWYWTAS